MKSIIFANYHSRQVETGCDGDLIACPIARLRPSRVPGYPRWGAVFLFPPRRAVHGGRADGAGTIETEPETITAN